MNVRYLLGALTLGLLGACAAVGPDYTGPGESLAESTAAFPSAAIKSPQQSTASVTIDTAPPVASWWLSFEDDTLNTLMSTAIVVNFDLRVASANLEAARASLREVGTRRLPTIDIGATAEERRQASAALVIADPDDRFPTTSFGELRADLAWEVDIFGRVRRSIEAAAADIEAVEAQRNDVAVAVLAQVARFYVDLRGAQVLLDVARRNVAVQQKTLELVELLNKEGAATQLDVARARTQLLRSQASMPSLHAEVTAALNRLTTLTARAPGTLASILGERNTLPTLPNMVAVGSPVELLRRRPDIRAAERALAAASARIGIATADLFPTITVGGTVGGGAAPASNLDSSGSLFFGLGPGLRWNLFNRDAIYARIKAVDSAAAANLVRYQRTVTTALQEVDTAIAAYHYERQRQQRLAQARDASHQASELARLRYREGVEDFLAVLDAERRLLETETEYARSRIAATQNLILIHLALGSGWDAIELPSHTPYAPE